MIDRILYLLLGVRKSIPFELKKRKNEPPPPGFYEWCKEFNVGVLCNKKSYFPD